VTDAAGFEPAFPSSPNPSNMKQPPSPPIVGGARYLDQVRDGRRQHTSGFQGEGVIPLDHTSLWLLYALGAEDVYTGR
jgi:hypothetical protein